MVEHLEKLLEAAKLGDFSGLAYIVKVAHRDHRAAVVGDFRRDPAAALQATFQLEKLLREDDFSNSA